MVMGCIIIQEVKRNYTLFYCLGGRPVSMQNFGLIVHIVILFLHGCGLHYNVLSGLHVSVKQEVKGLTTNYITMHYPGRKPVYLQIFEFIGATVREFRFFMRLRT